MEEEETAAAAVTDDFEDDTVTIRIDGDNIFWIGAPAWDEEQRAASAQEMLVQLRLASAGRFAPWRTGSCDHDPRYSGV